MSYKEIKNLSDRQVRRLKQKNNDGIRSASLAPFSPQTSKSNVVQENVNTHTFLNESYGRELNSVTNSFTSTDDYNDSSEFSFEGQKSYIPSAREVLREWVIENNVTCTAVNNLLPMLKLLGLDVPSDYRTLLKTPREIEITNIAPGSYSHLGLKDGVINSLIKMYGDNYLPPDNIKININVDGLPLTKSSGSQFWPILGAIASQDNCYTEPFVIGLYHGFSKPNDCNEFLKIFIEEAKKLLSEGLNFNGKLINFNLNAFICDAPAKSYITLTKGHTGYFSCTKCTQEGEYIQNRVTFPETQNPLRTDQSFILKEDEEYHRGTSIIECLGVGMVSQFILDYMHVVCLGVMKRLLQFWVKGNMAVRFNSNEMQCVSNKLLTMKSNITSDFARRPRSLNECDNWKATEFRQFLLYTGPIVLKSVLSAEKYCHFMSLSCAIRILASDLYLKWNDYAKSLLKYFVEKYSIFYGVEHITHNVHNLIHLPNDSKKFGKLDQFSAFKFENYLYKLKKKVRSSSKPLQQAIKRISEERESNTTLKKTTFEKKFVSIENYQFSVHPPNNCCVLEDNNILLINKIYTLDEKLFIAGKKFKNSNNFFNSPCESKLVGIQTINTDNFENVDVQSKFIKKKCIYFRSGENNEYIIQTILH